MITVSQIRGGRGYMERHLSSNDYYSEEETVVGHWRGKSALFLGLEGQEVTAQVFNALAMNRHPEHGDRLRPRDSKVSFHDFVVSAPKSVSIAVLVGGDERLREAYDECVEKAFARMESFAARRERKGKFHGTEETVRTGETIAAVYKHDTSRLLDPQLHTHLVYANVTWDQQAGEWFALQPKFMAEQSRVWIRGRFYRELEAACQRLGYRTQRDTEGFRLLDMPKKLEVIMSQRAVQKKRFEARYKEMFGHQPSKKRVDQFIKDRKGSAQKRFREEYEIRFGAKPTSQQVEKFVVDWRSDKMKRASSTQVAEIQRGRLTDSQWTSVQELVEKARVSEKVRIEEKSGQGMGFEIDQVSETPTPAQTARRVVSRREKVIQRQTSKALGRTEAIRRMKRGLTIVRALQGHPAALLASQIRAMAKDRNETKRRV